MSPAGATNLVLCGLLAVLVGAALYQFARPLARFSEQLDAVGSTTPTEDVEPADWKVLLYRGSALLVALVGALLAGRGALSLTGWL